MLHDRDDPLNSGDKIHGPARSLDHLAGDHPVGDVAVGGDFKGPEDREVDMPAADHGEGIRAGEKG